MEQIVNEAFAIDDVQRFTLTEIQQRHADRLVAMGIAARAMVIDERAPTAGDSRILVFRQLGRDATGTVIAEIGGVYIQDKERKECPAYVPVYSESLDGNELRIYGAFGDEEADAVRDMVGELQMHHIVGTLTLNELFTDLTQLPQSAR